MSHVPVADASMPPANPPGARHKSALARAVVAPLLLGALAACGFQPLALWPLTLLGVAGLIALVGAAPDRRGALLVGWTWGVGHFTLGNNWIATAFTYQAKMPAWLGWLAVFLLALYLAVFPALACLGGWLVGRRSRVGLVLAMAGQGDGLNMKIGWAYVALRVVHSLVQATTNRILFRFSLFALSSITLMMLASAI